MKKNQSIKDRLAQKIKDKTHNRRQAIKDAINTNGREGNSLLAQKNMNLHWKNLSRL